jgi:RimJ/RimL family protein N-acetyltransferase
MSNATAQVAAATKALLTDGHSSISRARARQFGPARAPVASVSFVPGIPTIETERLVMRPWREQDLDPYAELCADPEVMRYIGSGRTLDRDEAWRQIALSVGHWDLRGYGLWAVETKTEGSFIGRVGLWQPEGWPGLELGWALARSHWGHGYATEAGRASMEFAWTTVEAGELISLIQPANTASRRVAERLGMKVSRREMLGADEVLVYERARP